MKSRLIFAVLSLLFVLNTSGHTVKNISQNNDGIANIFFLLVNISLVIANYFFYKKRYNFSQKMGIKRNLSHSKTPLIKAAEELNHRLCKFSDQISNHWHNCRESEWRKPNHCYYLKSFVYRLLVFFYWIEKAENDIYNFDFSKAGKDERIYLKYIMTFNYFFCDSKLLEELNYNDSQQGAHFFKDMFKVYVSYIKEKDSVITYDQFAKKMETDSSKIIQVINFIVNIQEDRENCYRNVITSFHLFLMLFLNKYGLDYHQTKKKLFQEYVKKYNIVIKKGLMDFFERNKMTNEVKWIIEGLKNQ